MQECEETARRDFQALRGGGRAGRPQTRLQREQDNRIQQLIDGMQAGRIQLREFIEIASNFFEPERVNIKNKKLDDQIKINFKI